MDNIPAESREIAQSAMVGGIGRDIRRRYDLGRLFPRFGNVELRNQYSTWKLRRYRQWQYGRLRPP
jgi:hypothetical protein